MSIHLPLEVLEQIVEALVPTNVVVLRSSNIIAQTILSLTLVSRFLSPVAYHLLYTYCMDINSLRRLRLIVRSLKSQRVIDAISRPTNHVMGILLAPYQGTKIIDAPETLEQIELLCSVVGDKLQRLISDIPLEGLYELEDRKPGEVLMPLCGPFQKLTAIRDFCSITNEFAMSTCYTCQEPYFWGDWPYLERAAMLNSEGEPAFVKTLMESKQLAQVRLLMTNSNIYRVRDWGIPPNFHSLRYLILAHDIPYDILDGADRDPEPYSDCVGKIHEVDVPGLAKRDKDYEHVESRLLTCQEFMLEHACAGTLWDIGDDVA